MPSACLCLQVSAICSGNLKARLPAASYLAPSNAPCLPGGHAETLLWCLSQRASLDTTACLFASTERKQREGEAGEGNIPAGRAWVHNVSDTHSQLLRWLASKDTS